jgi:transcriptional regulator GlxA family with amidase domain
LCIIEMNAFGRISSARTHVRMAPLEYIATLLRCAETACGVGASNRSFDAALTEEIQLVVEASTILPPRAGTRGLRATAVVRACRFVNSHLAKPISLADLCRHCGVGTRTLEYGFRQFYDTTPIRFIKHLRLSRTRSALLRSCGQPVSIGQIAKRLGFTHMGQFAQDYRLLFGESPSATLQRARNGVAVPEAEYSARSC